MSQRIELCSTADVAPGNVIGMQGIVDWLELNGFVRASTVREPPAGGYDPVP